MERPLLALVAPQPAAQQHLRLHLGLGQPAQGQLLVVHLAPLAAAQAAQQHQVEHLPRHLAQVVHSALPAVAPAQDLPAVPLASVEAPAAQQQAAAAPQVAFLVATPLAARAVQLLAAAAYLVLLVLAAAAGRQAPHQCLAAPAAALVVPAAHSVLCYPVAVRLQQGRLCLALPRLLLLLQAHLLARLLPQQLAGCSAVPATQQDQQALAKLRRLVHQQQHQPRPLVAVQQQQAALLALQLPRARQRLVRRAARQLLARHQARLHSAHPAVQPAQALVCLVASAVPHLLDSSSSSSSLAVALRHRHSALHLASLHSPVVHLDSLLPLDSSSSSRQAALGSPLPSGSRQRLQRRLARQLRLGRRRRQQQHLARPVHLALLPAALPAEALLHSLLLPARRLARVAAALLHLLLQAAQGLAHWLGVGPAAARLSGLVRLGVRLLVARLARLHQRSSPACGAVRGANCCAVAPSTVRWQLAMSSMACECQAGVGSCLH